MSVPFRKGVHHALPPLRPVALRQVLRRDELGELIADDPRAHLLDLIRSQGPQRKRHVRQPDQPVHLQAQRLQHAAHLAVLALGQRHRDPEVRALLALLGIVELGLDGAIVDALDSDTVLQLVEPSLAGPPEGAFRVNLAA